MFIPFKVSNFMDKIASLHIAGVTLSAGSLVDIDPSDTSAIGASVGFTALKAGTLKLATIPAPTIVASVVTPAFLREYGVAIPSVNATGPSLQEKILELASSYMTIPVGYALSVFKPQGGDIIATDQFVGNLASDSGAPGILDTTNTANYLKPMGVFQGRFRIAQSTDSVRARYIGNSTANGAAVALFEFVS